MKIERSKPTFQPITITLQTPEDAKAFRQMLERVLVCDDAASKYFHWDEYIEDGYFNL
jgi:hypothetical protein